jgi:hypothetical protein
VPLVYDGAMAQGQAERWEPVVVAFGGRVYGLDPTTGQRVWSYEADASFQARVRLGVEGGRVFALRAGALSCLDLTTGSVIWHVVPGANGDTLLVHAGFIIIGGIGEACAHAALDGRLLWQDSFQGKGVGDVALVFRGVVAQADAHG